MSRARTATTRTFRSLRVRNYRLYFFGQIVSMSGTWMQSVAQAWLVLKLSGSGVDLGLVTALQFLPILVAGPWGGVIADRVDKRRLITVTQTCAAMLALALGVLTVTGLIQLWMIYLAALLLGTVNLVDMPARQSFVIEMVGRDELTNAVSLNSVVVNLARIAGPALAGLLIATVGIGICFLVNAGSYVAVIAAFILMRPEQLHRAQPVPRKRGQLREGLRYAWSNSELRTPLLLMAVVGTLAYNFSVIFPLLVKVAFHSGAGTFGVLYSIMGTGAVAGGLVIAARGVATRLLLAGSCLALGAALLAGATVPNLDIEMAVMIPIGAASTAFIATSNSLLQLGSTSEMRGRMMALFSVVFLGSTPIGGPLIGWLAQAFGPRLALGTGAVAAMLAGGAALVTARGAQRAARGRVALADARVADGPSEVPVPAPVAMPRDAMAGRGSTSGNGGGGRAAAG